MEENKLKDAEKVNAQKNIEVVKEITKEKPSVSISSSKKMALRTRFLTTRPQIFRRQIHLKKKNKTEPLVTVLSNSYRSLLGQGQSASCLIA